MRISDRDRVTSRKTRRNSLKQRNETRIAITLLIAVACLTPAASAASIVANGSFENGFYTAGNPNNEKVPNSWILGPPSFFIQSNLNVQSTVDNSIFEGPEDALNYVAFMSSATSGRDCLYQDLTTVAGQTYDISFWVAITAAAGNNIGLDVQWDENGLGQIALDDPAYSAPTNTGPVDYRQFTFSELATSSTTRIDFHAIDSSGAILLDNVVVTAQSSAPEPVAFIIAGSGLTLIGLLRKRRAV